MNKEEIRRYMLEQRNTLDDKSVSENTIRMLTNLVKNRILDFSCRLYYMFAPVNNEPDMFYFHDHIRLFYSMNYGYKPVFCYPLCDMENSILHNDDYVRPIIHFYGVEDYNKMKPGYMGIPEPKKDDEFHIRTISRGLGLDESDAVMFMPGLAFDKKGNRIGYGGGYYDRYLNHHTIKTKIAICYDFQIVKDLSELSNNKDNKVDYIVTEKRVIKIKEGK